MTVILDKKQSMSVFSYNSTSERILTVRLSACGFDADEPGI